MWCGESTTITERFATIEMPAFHFTEMLFDAFFISFI